MGSGGSIWRPGWPSDISRPGRASERAVESWRRRRRESGSRKPASEVALLRERDKGQSCAKGLTDKQEVQNKCYRGPCFFSSFVQFRSANVNSPSRWRSPLPKSWQQRALSLPSLPLASLSLHPSVRPSVCHSFRSMMASWPVAAGQTDGRTDRPRLPSASPSPQIRALPRPIWPLAGGGADRSHVTRGGGDHWTRKPSVRLSSRTDS